MPENKITTAIEQQVALADGFLRQQQALLHDIAALLLDCFHSGGRLFICGHGPFGALASLLGQAFLFRQTLERPALPAFALSNDAGLATFLAAEDQSDSYFSRQLRALTTERDVVLLLAGTYLGRADQEVIATVRQTGGRVVLIASRQVELGVPLPDITLAIPSDSEPRLLECTLTIGNLLCSLVEGDLFGI
ncbi:MAG: SIS domain-containing protein [Desulfuromonadales bacterium]|nr:SIS domain-containing protein [Desulfuromonadales bacterium]